MENYTIYTFASSYNRVIFFLLNSNLESRKMKNTWL